MAARISVKVRGADEVIRAARKLPRNGRESLREEAHKLAVLIAARAVRNAGGQGRQARRAAQQVRVNPGSLFPTIEAGSDSLLFGSEFGATRKFGWYARGRYYASRGKQFPPHLGGGSYWFLRSVDDEQPTIERAWGAVLSDVVRKWGA